MRYLIPAIALLFLRCHVAAGAESCTNPLPFPSDIVRRTFSRYTPCGPGPIQVTETAMAFRTHVIYRPRGHDYKELPNGRFACMPKYILRLTASHYSPLLEVYPYVEDPDSRNLNDIYRFCRNVEKTKKSVYEPWGANRQKYIDGMRTMVAGVKHVKDWGCLLDKTSGRDVWTERTFGNYDAGGIVTYLLGVAYNNGFCGE
ncbi:hypothetical protein BWQ96_05120 [Gracilariopsis chorda]|uniref:Uncharacterized protein n=1 Tax=Gracilariopsis chorda TaxID=448386 RepID=A0A2V3ISP9_9FLOR|nr:hypothetical protein BWQ96_05120 [Gracilariopsis chorda]|eukprot:PXF45146.1 hypothetical protein BWQ96_05120 [Gracilariopsis chorda]